jgi:hypothetical protein
MRGEGEDREGIFSTGAEKFLKFSENSKKNLEKSKRVRGRDAKGGPRGRCV